MKPGSIRLRLWSAAAISILVALAVAGVGLTYLFELHVERRVQDELAADLDQLIGATRFIDGRLQVTPAALTDPRFAVPFSGYYWQVEDSAAKTLVRSRSLWDETMRLPVKPADGPAQMYEIDGPDGELLLVLERTIIDAGGHAFRAALAEDHRTITQSVNAYTVELIPALLLLGAVLIAAIFVQVTVGLAPLQRLRAAVSDVVARRTARLDEAAPREVQPLADEINRLLEAQDKALARARSRATDLAHGLKTPLQVLAADTRRLRERGEGELASEIDKSAGAIRRHIEHELARARLAPGLLRSPALPVADVAGRVISVVKRTPEGERITFDCAIPADLTAVIDEDDLSEILGNLIENAARYAKSAIKVSACSTREGTTIAVADDGPGIAEGDREAVLSRGVRLDAKGGSGLGLAIVADIVEAYGGRLTMGDTAPGLTVSVFLPRAA